MYVYVYLTTSWWLYSGFLYSGQLISGPPRKKVDAKELASDVFAAAKKYVRWYHMCTPVYICLVQQLLVYIHA